MPFNSKADKFSCTSSSSKFTEQRKRTDSGSFGASGSGIPPRATQGLILALGGKTKNQRSRGPIFFGPRFSEHPSSRICLMVSHLLLWLTRSVCVLDTANAVSALLRKVSKLQSSVSGQRGPAATGCSTRHCFLWFSKVLYKPHEWIKHRRLVDLAHLRVLSDT